MEGCIPDQQELIRTSSNILWTMQFTRDISKDDKQYFPRTAS